MGSKIEMLEEEVRDVRREMADLKERVGGLEQNMSAVREFMLEITEALTRTGKRGKSPLLQSSKQARLLQIAKAIGSVGVTEEEEEQEIEGDDSPGTFKFLGTIGTRQVIVLIGTAATHNFISKKVVSELQIPVERTKRFRVSSGFGGKAKGAEVCNNIVLKTQGIEILQRFFPLDIVTADVVLGGEWLTTLGRFSIGCSRTLTMTFDWHGRTVCLKADPSVAKAKSGMEEIGAMILEWDE